MKPRTLLAIVLVAAAVGIEALLGAQTPAGPAVGGRYVNLAPAQQRMFDQVLQRYNAIARTRHTAAAAYDGLTLSRRTTFEAVTNALSTTTLSDEAGASLGAAIDLIGGVDEVLGKVRGARGDRQFRLYVLLAPDAVDRLARSREFSRGPDNTIYHPGFPVSFRLRGGTPSIQVSISRDGRRADVDVDYRSSRFPAVLVNGHLTSANSDVRAGNNYARHQRRWSGLVNWWLRFLALFSGPLFPMDAAADSGVIPVLPRTPGNAPIEMVVDDFLTGWLVEGRPQLSAAYFSHISFGCVPEPDHKGQGLERYVILERLKAASRVLGVVKTLRQASISVNPWDARLRVQRHRHGAAYLLARVPPDLASAYDCANSSESDGTGTLNFKEYYASAFRLRIPDGPAPALVLLWAKQAGGFRIVAMDVEEAAEPSIPIRGSRSSAAPAPPRARRVSGPAPLIEAATAFHRSWFIDRDVTRALSYFDEASYRCLPAVSDGVMRADSGSMRTMLAQVSAPASSRASLASAIRTAEPAQPGMDVVDHASRRAFTIIPADDAIADALACGGDPPAVAAAGPAPDAAGSGRAFVSYFQLNLPGDPAFIWMLWAPRADGWRIVYWTVVTP